MLCLRRGVASFVVFAMACSVVACAWSPVAPYLGQAPRVETLYVIAEGWHTELALSAAALSGPIVSLEPGSKDGRYMVFGWGERDYYMNPAPGLADLVKAAVPGPSVMLIIPLPERPAAFFVTDSTVFAVPVAKDGLERLSTFLWAYLEKDREGLVRRVGDGPYPGSGFYAARGTYDLANTCNTWTAEALHVAGLPVSATGVVFAGQIVAAVRAIVRGVTRGAAQ